MASATLGLICRPIPGMKKIPTLLAALSVLALLIPTSVFAAKKDTPKESKAQLIDKYDANKNGKLDGDEIAQIKSDFLANPNGELKRLDANHDGKLSDDELASLIAGKKQEKAEKNPTAVKKKKNGF